MIIKIIGGVLVLAAGSGLGFSFAHQWGKRLETLEAVRKMIFLLKGEILYANAPLAEALEQVGDKSPGALGKLFLTVSQRIKQQRGELFYTMWQEEVSQLCPECCLNAKDKQDLSAFGEHLGYLDVDQQERTILLYLEQLDLEIDYLRQHQREKKRLYTSLGIMGGLFLMIIMS